MVAAFRVDASVQIGTGHFMRCLTLADGLRHKGVQTLFVCRHLPDNFKNILHKKNHEIRRLAGGQRNETVDELSHAAWLGVSQLDDARDFLEAVSDLSIDWVIIDHYAIDKRWEIVVKSKETKILVLDDLADREHECDILLDQNVYSDMDDRYTNKVPTCCRLLLGPKYCLLRDEFRLNRKTVRVRTDSAKRILIFFGGVDPSNFTLNAIHALTSGPFLELDVDVVIGSMHPFRTEIEQTCLNNGFQCHVQIDDISKLMAKADICIGSGGTATLERCCLGLPTIAIPIANNQVKQIYDAALFGLLYAPEFVGDFISGLKRHLIAFLENPSLRNGISKRDLDLVDGNGIFHLISEMKCSGIQMRNAESADENNLFKWRNDPFIRANSRNADLIALEDHKKWFNNILYSSGNILLIGCVNDLPVGVVRFDIVGINAEISIYLIPEKERVVSGKDLLISSEIWVSINKPEIQVISACVLKNNARSHSMFLNAGYHLQSSIYSKKMCNHE